MDEKSLILSYLIVLVTVCFYLEGNQCQIERFVTSGTVHVLGCTVLSKELQRHKGQHGLGMHVIVHSEHQDHVHKYTGHGHQSHDLIPVLKGYCSGYQLLGCNVQI